MYHTYIFQEIPANRPNTPLLDKIDSPVQLRLLAEEQLPQLAYELRAYLLYSVGQSGGHFGAGLGVIELTIALHYVFNTPEDNLIWDVGHQTYPHKILTGRRDALPTIRHKKGLAAFPRRSESIYDTFGVGHSSTSISAALGMAVASRLKSNVRKSIAVIGDGALTAGMAFEALSHAGDIHPDMLVVLNDNDMSISDNVGGLKNYLAKLLSGETYNNLRNSGKKALSTTPGLLDFARKTEEHVKGMISPSTLFEELGFNYFGPVDGHDLPTLIETFSNIKKLEGPLFLHVVTRKGKGFAPAENDPVGFHAINKIAPTITSETPDTILNQPKAPRYSNIFGQWLCDMAERDSRLTGITPAMKEGSDLIAFAKRFPDRYFDVAIAEQHAVTLAAGMACEGLKPVVAIYSTFLQRAYDQLIHDVCVQNLDVLFAIDRAGLVGEDGPTHAGSFDLSFLRCIPGIIIMAPADENELRQMLFTGFQHPGPAAVRYPRGSGRGVQVQNKMTALPIGKAEIVRLHSGFSDEEGFNLSTNLLQVHSTSTLSNLLPGQDPIQASRIAILVFGTLMKEAEKSARLLDATLVNMRFIKPLDEAILSQLAQTHDILVTLEENVIAGGGGSGINEYLLKENTQTAILNLGLPDEYVEHGPAQELLKDCHLDAEGISLSIKEFLKKNNITSRHFTTGSETDNLQKHQKQ